MESEIFLLKILFISKFSSSTLPLRTKKMKKAQIKYNAKKKAATLPRRSTVVYELREKVFLSRQRLI
jgi:hypothetical protein